MRATPLDRAENRWYQVFDNPSPLLKQAPTVTATVIAALLTWWVPDLPMTHVAPAVAGIILVLAATAFAAVLTARGVHEGWALLLIPIVDIIGLGLFRTGTGERHRSSHHSCSSRWSGWPPPRASAGCSWSAGSRRSRC